MSCKNFKIRLAIREDISGVILLLINVVRKKKVFIEESLSEKYYRIFEKIFLDKNNELVVVENKMGEIIAACQVLYITTMACRGLTKCQIEDMCIKDDCKMQEVESELITWIKTRVKERGDCVLEYKERSLLC